MSEFEGGKVASIETAILDDIDHIAVATLTVDSLFSSETISQRVQEIWSEQEAQEPEVIKAMFDIGRFVQPIDPVLGIEEDNRELPIFMSGATIALEATGFAAEQSGLDRADVYKELRWHFMVPDLRHRTDIDQVERFTLTGRGVIERGRRTLAFNDETYGELIEMIEDQYGEVALHSGIFRGAFGYVLDAGMRSTAALLSQEQSDALLESVDFEAELQRMLDGQ